MMLIIRNIKINNVMGAGIEGLFINVYNSVNIHINVENAILDNFYNFNGRQGSILAWHGEHTQANYRK